MDQFTSAESVTRFLRNKNSTPDAVVTTARNLLAGKYSLYLPNLAIFVFDLVCDRIGDFAGKNFLRWKFCPQLWQLWAEVWQILALEPLDREIRAKSFRKVKTILVLVAVLDEISARASKEKFLNGDDSQMLLRTAFLCLDLFLTSGYIDVDEFNAVGLIKSYSEMLLALDPQVLAELPINEWTALISRLYELPHQTVTYKPAKKSMAKYFNEVLPIHLALFSSRKNVLPVETYTALHAVFTSILFDLERTTLAVHLASVMENPLPILDEAGILVLFQEVIANLASSDISVCEAIYLKLTTGKFATMAEPLITVLSQVNKTLSSTFFAETYTKELAQEKPNWSLISHLLRLDPELVVSKWKQVISGCAKEPLDKLTIIAENLVLGFVRARDFPLFAHEVYPFALTVSKHWASPEVLAKLTPRVNELSGNQIARLSKQFLESKELKPLSLLVQGLLFCPLSKQKTALSLFENYSFCQPGWSEIAYYVLCVYGEPVLKSQPEILTKVLGKTLQPVSKADLDLVFRIAELTGDASHIDSKNFLSYIQSMNSTSLIPFAERWVVISSLFSGAYAQWFKSAFQKLDMQQILHYLLSHQTLLCELPLFLSELLKFLQESKYPATYELLGLFPPLVIRKYFGDFLGPMCTDAIKDPENATIRKTLRHIFQEPVLNSLLEKDFSLLQEFVAKSSESTLADTLEIASCIWTAHINTIKTTQSKEYVEKAIEKLRKSLKKPLKADLLMARVVLSIESTKDLDNFERFLEKYVSAICESTTTENLEKQLAALSELPNLTEKAKQYIRKTIREFGSKKISAECQAQLFALVAKTSTPEDAQFIVALFVALRQSESTLQFQDSNRESLIASIKTFLQTISDDVYTDIFAHTITSLRDSPAEYVDLLVEVGSTLSLFLNKESEPAHAQLLVAFLLAFTERYADIKNPGTILLFVGTVTDLLSEKTWAFKQYTVELVFGIAHLLSHELDFGTASEKVYISVVKLVSYVVLFHRYRFSSRYHLVIKVLSDMMLPISNTGVLRGSSKSAAAYSRLLTSFCEPPNHVTTKDSDSLTSRTALFRKALRKHAHILLVNYIHIRLNHRFSGDVNDQMMPGVYSVFSLLSKAELLLANQCLDTLGRAYYQSLYSTYKDHGKWRE